MPRKSSQKPARGEPGYDPRADPENYDHEGRYRPLETRQPYDLRNDPEHFHDYARSVMQGPEGSARHRQSDLLSTQLRQSMQPERNAEILAGNREDARETLRRERGHFREDETEQQYQKRVKTERVRASRAGMSPEERQRARENNTESARRSRKNRSARPSGNVLIEAHAQRTAGFAIAPAMQTAAYQELQQQTMLSDDILDAIVRDTRNWLSPTTIRIPSSGQVITITRLT